MIALFAVSCSSSGNKKDRTKQIDALQKKVLEITNENATLKKILAERLITLCDTESAETKLKKEQYAEFEAAAMKKKNKLETVLEMKKNTAELAASTQKNNATLKLFMENRKKLLYVYQEWEQNDNKTFIQYVTLKFYDNEGGYLDVWRRLNVLEKSKDPNARKVFDLRRSLDAEYAAKEKIAQEKYEKTISDLGKKCEQDIAKAQQDYTTLCSNKRKELGL